MRVKLYCPKCQKETIAEVFPETDWETPNCTCGQKLKFSMYMTCDFCFAQAFCYYDINKKQWLCNNCRRTHD